MLPVIFDFAVIVIIFLCIYFSARKGFINSSYKIASILLTVVLMLLFQDSIGQLVGNSPIGEAIRERVTISVEERIDNAKEQEITDNEPQKEGFNILGLPSFYSSVIEDSAEKFNDAKNELIEDVSTSIAESIINIVSIILLYIVIRIVLFILFKVLNVAFKLPVLRTFNKLLGAVAGAAQGLFIVYILCAVLMWVIQSQSTNDILTAVEGTVVTQYFYNNNILLGLFI